MRLLEQGTQTVRLQIVVSDTGIGMAPDVQARIFDAFAQADSSTTRRFECIGVGLAISKRLVQLMGGDMGVKSTPGAGSTFWFTLTLARAEALPRPVTADPVSRRSLPLGKAPRFTARVLVAEDNPVNQEVAVAMLESLGCQVTVAADGHAALAAFGTPALQSGADGLPNAGAGWAATTAWRQRENCHRQLAGPHRRLDRQRHQGRAGAMPGGGDGRLSEQTVRTDATGDYSGTLVAPRPCGRFPTHRYPTHPTSPTASPEDGGNPCAVVTQPAIPFPTPSPSPTHRWTNAPWRKFVPCSGSASPACWARSLASTFRIARQPCSSGCEMLSLLGIASRYGRRPTA
ncbi:MAG: ATP-binding protein [Candidatus Competibacteraceae bacterium]